MPEQSTHYDDVTFAGPHHDRPLQVERPAPDVESLRASYLGVLKLALCELVGTRTTQVLKDPEGEIMSRVLNPDKLWIRAGGLDWPQHGLTMAGLLRLDDLQACVESVVADGVEGDLIEAGTWRGGSAILMRAALDTLGDAERTVVVADSFQGFPVLDDEPEGTHLERSDFLAVPLEEVRGNFERFGLDSGVEFVPGFFEDTLGGLRGRTWSIVRLDGDTYDATVTSLEALYPGLAVGGYLVVDDYGAIEECRRAVDDFRERNDITEPLEEVDWTCVRWRREQPAAAAAAAPADPAPAERPQPIPRTAPADLYIPSMGEAFLGREHAALLGEAEQLRERLATAEAEVAALRAAPLRGPRAWLRDRLGKGRGR